MNLVPVVLATLFITPVSFGAGTRLLLLLPLAASISIVYKAIRCDNVRELPLASLVLWITVVGGMMAVGVVLLLAYRLIL